MEDGGEIEKRPEILDFFPLLLSLFNSPGFTSILLISFQSLSIFVVRISHDLGGTSS